jgi:hypothetical protein
VRRGLRRVFLGDPEWLAGFWSRRLVPFGPGWNWWIPGRRSNQVQTESSVCLGSTHPDEQAIVLDPVDVPETAESGETCLLEGGVALDGVQSSGGSEFKPS